MDSMLNMITNPSPNFISIRELNLLLRIHPLYYGILKDTWGMDFLKHLLVFKPNHFTLGDMACQLHEVLKDKK